MNCDLLRDQISVAVPYQIAADISTELVYKWRPENKFT